MFFLAIFLQILGVLFFYISSKRNGFPTNHFSSVLNKRKKLLRAIGLTFIISAFFPFSIHLGLFAGISTGILSLIATCSLTTIFIPIKYAR